MFTMRDFNRIKHLLKVSNTNNFYSENKNELCWKMSRLDSTAMGQAGELLMCDKLHRARYSVKPHGHGQIFDILLNDHIRCEVKTAKMILQDGRYKYYKLQKIKPECFDILFMVFVTPRGIVFKWTESKYVTKYIQEYNCKRGKEGYTLCFDSTCDNPNIAYDDHISNFMKFYPNSCVATT